MPLAAAAPAALDARPAMHDPSLGADPAWLDAQYNNRARVPEAVQILARWAASSAAVRERLPHAADVAYGPEPGDRLDLFPAAGGAPDPRGAPVLVFIHGGYWRALDKSDHSFVAEPFVRGGALVLVPNYDLSPRVTIASIAVQCARALAWAWRHAGEHGGDPRRIAVVGHSAGGHLAAMLACCDWSRVDAALPAAPMRGALAISGLFDLDPVQRTPFLADDLRLAPQDVARISPARFPAPRGPVLACVGGEESPEFIRQNGLLRERWGAAAVPVSEVLDGFNHFTVLDDLVSPQGRLHALAWQLMAA
jgi:arylformamidase